MNAPLTVKWFQKEVKAHVSKSAEYKNIESHVKSVEALEKSWKSKPVDPQAVKLLNNALNNVQKTLGAVKQPNNNLKAAQLKVFKAINDFKDDHNTKFVDKLSSAVMGQVPGGLKALAAIGIKEWSAENQKFRDATKAVKTDDTTKLLKLYKDFRQDINLSNGLFKAWDKSKTAVVTTTKELQDAAKNGDDAARKKLLPKYKTAVQALHKVTTKARNEIIKLQNDGVVRFKSTIKMI